MTPRSTSRPGAIAFPRLPVLANRPEGRADKTHAMETKLPISPVARPHRAPKEAAFGAKTWRCGRHAQRGRTNLQGRLFVCDRRPNWLMGGRAKRPAPENRSPAVCRGDFLAGTDSGGGWNRAAASAAAPPRPRHHSQKPCIGKIRDSELFHLINVRAAHPILSHIENELVAGMYIGNPSRPQTIGVGSTRIRRV